MNHLILQPIVQYGFLGLSAILLGMVVWLIRRLLCVLEKNNRVIAANTEAITRLGEDTDDLLKLNRSLHDKIISRPCIAAREASVGGAVAG